MNIKSKVIGAFIAFFTLIISASGQYMGRDFGLKWKQTLRGDITLAGNTVIKGSPTSFSNSGQVMNYVNVDISLRSLNSSTSRVVLVDRNGTDISKDACTNIKKAVLYWFGRVDNTKGLYYGGRYNKNFDYIDYNGRSHYFGKNYSQLFDNRNKVKIKYGDDVKDVEAKTGDFYEISELYGKEHIYSASADVTDFVKRHKAGSYTVGDIKTMSSSSSFESDDVTADGLGFFGGWTLVVIYENEKMQPKSVSIFDGLKNVSNSSSVDIEIRGFSTPRLGDIDAKIGFSVIEGDYNIPGDYLLAAKTQADLDSADIERYKIYRRGSDYNNVFNGNIKIPGFTGNDERLNVNYGVDMDLIVKDDLPEGVIYNGQSEMYLRFGTKGDTYFPNLFVSSITDYVPDPVGVGSYTGPETVELGPGDKAEFKIDVYNFGNEDIKNGKIFIPIPKNVDFKLVSFVATLGRAEKVYGNIPPSDGMPERIVPNGYIVWNIGKTIPTTNTIDPKPLATLNYVVQISKDCDKLKLLCDGVPVSVKIDGFMRGQGVYSGKFLNDPSIISKKRVEGDNCRAVPSPDRENSVVITRADQNLVCTYPKDKLPITTCVGRIYDKGFPTFNLTYADELADGEKIIYEWHIYKVSRSNIIRVNTGTDINKIIDIGRNPTPVSIGFGVSGTFEVTSTNGDNGGVITTAGVPQTVTAPVDKNNRPVAVYNNEQLFIRVKAAKYKNGNRICIERTEYTPIELLAAPSDIINSAVEPRRQPICSSEGKILIDSQWNKSSVLVEDPETGNVISGVRYTLLYKIFKKGSTDEQIEASPVLQTHFNGDGKSVINLYDKTEGEYTYRPIRITNGSCFVDVRGDVNFEIKKQILKPIITSDGKSFTLKPTGEPGTITKYKLYKKQVTKDPQTGQVTETYKPIKLDGTAYKYLENTELDKYNAEGGIPIPKETVVKIPNLEGEYKVELTSELKNNTTGSCAAKDESIIIVDKSLKFHYINPSLRIRVKQ